MASQQNPSWMNQPWQVILVDSGSGSLGVTDTVIFTPQNTITYQHTTSQTLNQLQSSSSSAQVWGTWNPSTVTANRLEGYRSPDQTPFHIDYVNGQLECRMDSPRPSRWLWAVILGAILGTPIGALAGVVAGFPAALSALVALAASLPASLLAARVTSAGMGTTSTATWVANDGGANKMPKPGQHTLKAVGA